MSETQLFEAARDGDVTRVQAALDAGATASVQDEHGWTPLKWAAGAGHLDVVEALLARGAEPFAQGPDLRSAYDVALAAGRVEAARRLRDAARAAGMPDPPARPYCKAYLLDDVRRFAAWPSEAEHSAPAPDPDPDADPDAESLDDIVFVHQDLTVTCSMWHGEDVLLEDITPEWEAFCREELAFRVPDDLELAAGDDGGDATS